MATSIKLKSDIKKIEAAIKSKATPKSLVPKLQAQLEKIKDELASLNSPKPKKGVTKTKVLSSLQKLKAKVKSTKSLAGYKKSGIDLKKDAEVPALPLGKRYSQTTGNPYYEYRLNRADVKQPPKRYPKLEDGGMMAKGGEIEEGDYVFVKPEKLNAEVVRITGENVVVEFNDRRPQGGDKRGNYKIKDLKKMSDNDMMASGGRLKSAVNRDRAYKSDEAWEQSYKRKSRPKNPKYTSSDKGIFDKGGYMAEGGLTYETDMKPHFTGVDRYYVTTSDGKKNEFTSVKEFNSYLESLKKEGYKEMASGGYMAMGGMLKHGLMIGDEIIGYSGDVVQVQNRGNFFVVNLQEGKRETLDKFRMDKYAQGGELHRLEQGM